MLKISLDAGHGKNTPGKRSPDGMHEWEFNSTVVKNMMSELATYDGVALLRLDDPTGDNDVSLHERTKHLNAWGSSVQISVHANANGSNWNDSNGIETFVYLKSDTVSQALAQVVQNKLIALTGRRSRGVKKGDLHMVREPKCPAILVECGFMTNKEEASLLLSDNYRQKVAHAIVEALVEYYNLKKANQAIMWDGAELKKGQIGRITILKPINLWKRVGDKLEMVRVMNPGEVFRVYGYDDEHGGQYNVGDGYWITKMEGYVKYETPSKNLLDQVK